MEIYFSGRNAWACFDGLIDQVSVYSFSSDGYLKHNPEVIHILNAFFSNLF